MSIATLSPPKTTTLAELLKELGDIPPERILVNPPMGTATEKDLLALVDAADKRLVELIDGVLVEKTMGMVESFVTAILIEHIAGYLRKAKLGLASAPDGPIRVSLGQVRMPDICIFTWDTLGSRKAPAEAIYGIAPDIAVEIISAGNTRKEMERKLRDYFNAGVIEVWFIYPKNQTARIYSSPESYKRISSTQALTSDEILPGFELPLATVFENIDKGNNGGR